MGKSLKVIVIGTIILSISQNTVFASNLKKIEVSFNQVNIVVNDKAFKSNNILYLGTTYIPIRDAAAMLGLAVNYYGKTKTTYIGQIGAGEFTEDNHDIDSWDTVTPATPSNDPIVVKSNKSISVSLNDIKIKVEGTELVSDNILYNGRTYVPLRAASESIGLPIKYDGGISTVYLGKTSHVFTPEAVKAKPQDSIKKSGMYEVPATGEMAGWQLLKGHKYEKEVNIYFTVKGSIVSSKLVPIQKRDLTKVIEWTDTNGEQRKTKLGDLYDVFQTFSGKYTDDFLSENFGDLYFNWLEESNVAMDVDLILDQYLQETGKIAIPGDNITLTPDAQIELVPTPTPRPKYDLEIS